MLLPIFNLNKLTRKIIKKAVKKKININVLFKNEKYNKFIKKMCEYDTEREPKEPFYIVQIIIHIAYRCLQMQNIREK